MIYHDQSSDGRSALDGYRLPPLAFLADDELPGGLRPFWNALRGGSRPPASLLAELAYTIECEDPALRAPLYLGLAMIHLRAGKHEQSAAAARESLLAQPQQHAAHRVLIEIFWEKAAYDDAYFYLSTLNAPSTVDIWDEVLSPDERHVALAALAWQVQDWNGVRDHLSRAFPPNISDIPLELREDLFRAALYQGSAQEAAETAASLLPVYDVDHIDQMLHTLDARGWSAEALELYRRAFNSNPTNPLLRRRLVGLYIREGHLGEARTLAEGMPLDLAA